ncbi:MULTISPECIES: LLM class flavin-dependent oxidoreductase [unclassified Modestobacter]|uniref:LLM class flavin-dependent oxidoreductase n=1 Tax=unclassified Modestobacter TaxID=2643866 RepID=UPI0022AA38A9|nr:MULTISPECIES: LLM class flavin-dependent oxidoreductase [unclassified Modestobacter]MCZ2811978.1 LLM class flavin-dependent oxidoreductase [Modestobacter sp. VKM Ac-2979]MCZ2843702.1 LLM class flavin-dependent oxidoreductase [Modestobacter sp. VKM Ac-2980]MCZ2849875.1 LLM class flavin-dependent oxidoreductase [Modestobacter sp. VKM Ac-2978]
MSELEFYLWNGNKYSFIPRRDQLGKSIFITTSTKYYDPLRGQQIFEDFIEDAVFAEQLGYDGLVVLEQHGGPNAVVTQPIVLASALAARTSNIRIGTVGALLNSYLTPMRYAEEVAALDILSRGRYFFGLPMGIGANYHSLAMMNPTDARERYYEAHEFLKRAFTEEGPFDFDGKYFSAPYANLWPKPMQQPYPEVWVPAAGSKETLQFASRERYCYMAVLVPWPVLQRNAATFRELCQAEGYEMDPRQLVAQSYVHVAETDKQARQEVEAHYLSVQQNSFGSPFHDSFPPGYASEGSLRGMALGGGYRSKDASETTIDEAIDNFQLICGSVETVAERIEEYTSTLGAGRLLVTQDAWTMPSWMARKNMTMFAEEVMPKFRARTGKPIWDTAEEGAAFRTRSEYGARVQEPISKPMAWVDGHAIDIRTSHIPELRVPLEDTQK